jgi:integrase
MVSSKKDLQRSLELSQENPHYANFYDAIKTDASRRSYTYGLKKFMTYLFEKKKISHIEDFQSLIEFDSGKSTDLVKLFIKNLKQKVKPTSVNAYVAPLFLFFEMNRVVLFHKEINKVKDKNDLEQSGHTPVSDSELQDMIRICNHPRDIALILFLSSTGLRPGGLNDPVLQRKHLQYMADPQDSTDKKYCYAVKIYDGSRQHYWGFLTPEATKALDKYFAWRKNTRHEELTDDSPVFAAVSTRSSFENMTGYSLYKLLNKIYAKSGLTRKKEGNRYDKAMTYMYRIRFNTKLKLNNDVNSNIAEKLMAHKKGLDGTYLQPTREECYAEFVKAVPELTVDGTARKEAELEATRAEKTELQKKVGEIEEMKLQQADENARRDKALEYLMKKEKERTLK